MRQKYKRHTAFHIRLDIFRQQSFHLFAVLQRHLIAFKSLEIVRGECLGTVGFQLFYEFVSFVGKLVISTQSEIYNFGGVNVNFGPCIGYYGLDTQENLHPSTTVNIGDIAYAKDIALRLKNDHKFY